MRNRWYIGAFSHEVSRAPLERTLLDVPVLFYRTEAGEAVAMYGLCPHRYYPLAKGKVVGDAIQCGYHGFTFAANGKCIRVPSQSGASQFVQPTYPLTELGPWIWIWLGDPAKADPGLIPPYADFGLDQPNWHYSTPSHFRVRSRTQLLIDNLMDLTHVDFLHGTLIDADVLTKTTITTETRDKSLRLNRKTRSPWTGFHEMLYGADHRFTGLSDMNAVTDFYGPELVRTSGPITTAIDGQAEVPAEIGQMYFLHGLTPETAQSVHYFGLVTRDFRVGDVGLDAVLEKVDPAVRQQDVDAAEIIESRLESAVGRQRELLVRSDAPAVRVRDLIQAMLDAEMPMTPLGKINV